MRTLDKPIQAAMHYAREHYSIALTDDELQREAHVPCFECLITYFCVVRHPFMCSHRLNLLHV